MKVKRTVTVNLEQEEIDALVNAVKKLTAIEMWCERQDDKLPNMSAIIEKAEEAHYAITDFLQFMVSEDEYSDIEDRFDEDII